MVASALSVTPSFSSSFSVHKKQSYDSIAQTLPSPLYPTLKRPKPLKLISQSLSLPPHLPLLLPFHRCRCSAAFDVAAQSSVDESEEEIEEEIGDEGTEQEEQDGEIQELDTADNCRLFVGNLPYSTNSSQLAEIFGESGHVVSAEIIYDRVTDRSRGFAFVTMGSVEEAKKAIRMFDGAQIGGRSVKVNFPEVPRGGERKVMGARIRNTNQSFVDTPHKIYAGNLGWNLSSQGLKDTFAERPGFLSAKVIYERETGRSRGFGFVTFSSAEEAESALKAMNGLEVEGRPLRLNMAAERARSAHPETLENKLQDSVDHNEMLSGAVNFETSTDL